jgi:hypothetical protein
LPVGGCVLHASVSVSCVLAISNTYSMLKPVFRKEKRMFDVLGERERERFNRLHPVFRWLKGDIEISEIQ